MAGVANTHTVPGMIRSLRFLSLRATGVVSGICFDPLSVSRSTLDAGTQSHYAGLCYIMPNSPPATF